MEENKNVSKNSWKRIFKKKWFFPAVYLAVAALVLTGVLWYQNAINQAPDIAEDMENQLNDLSGDQTEQDEEDATTVMQQQEVLQMPVPEDLQVEIVTKFYDYGADAEAQEQALISHQNKFYQSDGIAISTSDHQAFDVKASLSGQVVEVKQDPLLGNVVKMEHEQGISTYYASLDEVLVEKGTDVKQGDSIGTAGQNVLGQDNGVHVHFEVRKDGTPVNPENFVNQPIHKIIAPDDSVEEEAPAEESEDSDDTEEETDESADEEQEDAEEDAEETNESSSAMERT
ncbi:M23 family metallopeptidase [Gracilibacillus kekensis]|uniref:Stage II sporulation protein Q n=1 Tax=Gracilibacillus kekensis TaxID=1027249 RepID=A0A1M7K925_9BACI|nr:M23 family metallopeptidase [Gracilibacillus kekensis]SHM61715.1 stage II sporulation protein Q [Gracilibacillus kekensis]